MLKRILSVAIAFCFVLSLTAALAESPIRVAVVQPLTHTSLNQIRDTIVSELEKSDTAFEIVTRNAEGDSTATSISEWTKCLIVLIQRHCCN